MDLYRRQAHDISTFCNGFVCPKSGLSETRVLQILNKENTLRNEYALVRNISNMYAVQWSSLFAQFAREKVKLCLYPTTPDGIIFETEVLNEWFSELHGELQIPVALEVIISQSSIDITESQDLDVYQIIEDDIENFLDESNFNDPSAVSRRGATLQMGCDYLVQNNKTHAITNFVCAYGLIYFTLGSTNDFVPVAGTACSECDFYETRPYFRSSEKSEKWACMPQFPYLCADLDREEKYPGNYRYECTEKKTSTPSIDVTWVTVTGAPLPFKTPPPYIWPCLKYSVPIIALTALVIVIIGYQIYSLIGLKNE